MVSYPKSFQFSEKNEKKHVGAILVQFLVQDLQLARIELVPRFSSEFGVNISRLKIIQKTNHAPIYSINSPVTLRIGFFGRWLGNVYTLLKAVSVSNPGGTEKTICGKNVRSP